mmetsp:Transcript_8047/g.12822  ORF Transcript_8047/g.12822 Transcript_8047/m.12822 type:complete len:141 (-) Transcript_8047:218-640(-)
MTSSLRRSILLDSAVPTSLFTYLLGMGPLILILDTVLCTFSGRQMPKASLLHLMVTASSTEDQQKHALSKLRIARVATEVIGACLGICDERSKHRLNSERLSRDLLNYESMYSSMYPLQGVPHSNLSRGSSLMHVVNVYS